MAWKRKSDYHMAYMDGNYEKAWVNWTDAKDHCLLYVAGNPEPTRFDSVKDAIASYKK